MLTILKLLSDTTGASMEELLRCAIEGFERDKAAGLITEYKNAFGIILLRRHPKFETAAEPKPE